MESILRNCRPIGKRVTVLADRTQLFTGDRAGAGGQCHYGEEPSLREMASSLVLDVTLYGQLEGQDVSPIVTRLPPPGAD